MLTGTARWVVFDAAVALVLAWISALPLPVPGLVFLLRSWDAPYGWLAIAVTMFIALWIGHQLLRRHETWLRATAIGLVAVYVLAVLNALVSLEAVVGQV